MNGRRRQGRGKSSTTTNAQVTAETETVAMNEQPELDLDVLCKKYKNLGGQQFFGIEPIIKAQAWLRSCTRICKGFKRNNDQKRYLASWQLQNEALAWWESITYTEPEENFSWEQFK